MTASTYPDDGVGEVFLKLGKQGSTLAGVMDAFSMAISVGLQYGIPLESYVAKFTNMRFDPAGMTDDPDIRIATSMMDYIFRRLALDHLPYDQRAELGILSAAERAAQLAGQDPASLGVEVDPVELAQSAAVENTASSERVPPAAPAAPPPAASPASAAQPARRPRATVPAARTPPPSSSSSSRAGPRTPRCASPAAPRCARRAAATSAKAAAPPAAARNSRAALTKTLRSGGVRAATRAPPECYLAAWLSRRIGPVWMRARAATARGRCSRSSCSPWRPRRSWRAGACRSPGLLAVLHT